VTGEPYEPCGCGLGLACSGTGPFEQERGMSIPCEMNKFDDMVELLSAHNANFTQVVAVDQSFKLFSRAWCVAEIAAAHKMGMLQKLKVLSMERLNECEGQLRHMRIKEMQASRLEDVDLVLGRIPDQETFDAHVQALTFEQLLPGWRSLDPIQQLDRVGHVYRWRKVLRWEAMATTSPNSKSHVADVENSRTDEAAVKGIQVCRIKMSL